jgi:PBP1b-binding outer membrane lipoprotein LpoB
MKKRHAIIASAALLLVGCANDETVVNNTPTDEVPTGAAIDFNLTVPGQTRSTLAGKYAADALGSKFVVYGIKHTTSGSSVVNQDVFKNYLVEWTNNSAGTSESNTNNWEYVGTALTATEKEKVTPNAEAQTVKYWDYSADQGYTFTAFSGSSFLGKTGAAIRKITDGSDDYANGYQITVPSSATPNEIYFSDRVKVTSTDYDKPVVLTFRNFGSKVRVGFYETVPGYSVKINKFYFDNTAVTSSTPAVTTFAAMTAKSTDNFKAALRNVGSSTSSNNILTVTYNNAASGIENQPTVVGTTVTYTNTLSLGSGITSATALAETSSNPTWDTGSGDYTFVYPNEACNQPMLIRCDYTLTSTDGSNEKIEIKNARVVVPAEYCQWKPNFAYTYLFKISDNTNGTTGADPSNPDNPDADKEGLHPITFDAVVVDATTGNQETISTVATNTVTTYAKNASLQGDYNAGQPIYVVNTNTNTKAVIAPTAIGTAATEAQVYKMSKAATEGELIAQLNGTKMGITLTEAGASLVTDGKFQASDDTNYDFGTKGAVTFTPAALAQNVNTEYYAYVYTTKAYTAAVYDAVDGGTSTHNYADTETYYMKTQDNVYYTASKVDQAFFNAHKSELYVLKTPAVKGEFDVKVITVK